MKFRRSGTLSHYEPFPAPFPTKKISDFRFAISDFRYGNVRFLISVHGKSINLKNTLRIISDFGFLISGKEGIVWPQNK